MVRNYRSIAFVLFLFLLAPALAAHGAQYDAPGIGSMVQGQAKVVTVIGAGASGAPAGFTVQWMDYSDYVANGSQWPEVEDPRRAVANFSGVPTLNTWDGTLESFTIAPWAFAAVEIGDLFDETGVETDTPTELYMGTSYIFRVRANGDAINDPSEYSNSLVVATGVNTNCTLTQGFWKNHVSAWPTEQVTLGTVTYATAQLVAILDEPARGNGLVILAHQLIAAELNIEQGADLSDVADVLAEAHAMIGSMIVPPLGIASIPPRDVTTLAQTIDDFNNGVIGPGHCNTVSVEDQSWGEIKAAYR